MAVNDRFDFWTFLHDGQMKADLARRLPFSGQLFAVHVHDAEIFRRHEPLGDHRRRADDFILADPKTDVSVISSRVAAFVQTVANRADFLLDLVNIPHGFHPLTKNYVGFGSDQIRFFYFR